jgi:hypothetical protein
MSGRSRPSISSRRPRLAQLGLEDQRGRAGEHLHEGLVALGQVLVGRQPRGAERAVERAVRQRDGDGDVAADARHPRGGQGHRRRVLGDVGDHGRQVAVEDRLAEARGLHLGRTLAEQQAGRAARLDHLEVLGGAVQARQERHGQAQGVPGGREQLGDLLLGAGSAMSGHAVFSADPGGC